MKGTYRELTEGKGNKNKYKKYYQDLTNGIKQIKETEKKEKKDGVDFPLSSSVELHINGTIRRNWEIRRHSLLKWKLS